MIAIITFELVIGRLSFVFALGFLLWLWQFDVRFRHILARVEHFDREFFSNFALGVDSFIYLLNTSLFES